MYTRLVRYVKLGATQYHILKWRYALQLIPITTEDEDLAVRLECDPEMMLYIGGPRSEPDVRLTHKRRLKLMDEGEAYMYKIVAEDSNEVMGTIGIWRISWKSPYAWETGWFVLPEHQGKGVATSAAHLILTEARSNPEIHFVYAYPAVSNVASNVIARKIGMNNLGQFDNEGFAGVLRCNDWCIDVRQP